MTVMRMTDPLSSSANRRCFLIRSAGFAAGVGFLSVLPLAASRATPQAMQEAIWKIVGEAAMRHGKVTLDVPPLVENGNAVPLTVSVDSSMTEADHVKAIHVVNEKNPQPHVISAALGPRAGRASLSTRIKLADSQQVVALAEMSDGSFWSESADIIVTIAACVEDLR
jgi:sulfur-oxidizing protein SoxY